MIDLHEARTLLDETLAAHGLSSALDPAERADALAAILSDQPCLLAPSYHHQAALRIARAVNADEGRLADLLNAFIASKPFGAPADHARGLLNALVPVNDAAWLAIAEARARFVPQPPQPRQPRVRVPLSNFVFLRIEEMA